MVITGWRNERCEWCWGWRKTHYPRWCSLKDIKRLVTCSVEVWLTKEALCFGFRFGSADDHGWPISILTSWFTMVPLKAAHRRHVAASRKEWTMRTTCERKKRPGSHPSLREVSCCWLIEGYWRNILPILMVCEAGVRVSWRAFRIRHLSTILTVSCTDSCWPWNLSCVSLQVCLYL